MNIFGKELKIKEFQCNKNHCNDLIRIKESYVNIYVKINDVCQARCKFCEFCSNSNTFFDHHKLYYILNELQKKVIVNKISFTGGEPTIDMTTFCKIIKIAREACPNSFFNVNTNGYKLWMLEDYNELDCIALSRHHYDEQKNLETFDRDTSHLFPSNSEIGKFVAKSKIHFSCNLIKGYIDSEEEIYKYLDWAASVGVYDVGFVTLMKVNQYCIDHHVDFRDITFNNPNMFHNQSMSNGSSCECRNYLYNPPNSEGVVRVYARYNYDYESGSSVANLVFNGANLKNGFNGEIIV